ncbi:uncharacterized protein LOC130636753 [Hydractinia symbiolongicarpus]|uniref:uncharacterized protein LOC130636753 n=1 Tax=Hydractinia symbiolongicarpus TaxID=13093 RepID=UPI0025501371|nr:uncharacterized protein LOC130636753 [Hydractinia symbiolongicarpus]XP_057302572.1 uncharacterized protein LOC130636753 [Hydractinia symbiolongicarpus]XP_057302573.1 uncharacterized protein LOC130636753 [Hydractinia symbiolongicarpus]
MTENTAAVFGNYGDYSKSKVKLKKNPHYYPSLSKYSDQKTRLNPHFIDKPANVDYGNPTEQNKDPSFETDDQFISLIELDGKSDRTTFVEDISNSTKYNESWPNIEQVSSFESPFFESFSDGISTVRAVGDFGTQKDVENENEGTLAKYVQRFREQPPQSRQERQGNASDQFWWTLSSPSNASTPKTFGSDITSDASNVTSGVETPVKSNKHRIQKHKNGHLFRRDEETESETNRIQLRANKLLEMSESTLNSSYSSLSQGCKQSANKYRTLVSDYKKKTADNAKNSSLSSLTLTSQFTESQQDRQNKDVGSPLRPEDDILQQWRLARKMELASLDAEKKTNAFLERKVSLNFMQRRNNSKNNEDIKTFNDAASENIQNTNERNPVNAMTKQCCDSNRLLISSCKENISKEEHENSNQVPQRILNNCQCRQENIHIRETQEKTMVDNNVVCVFHDTSAPSPSTCTKCFCNHRNKRDVKNCGDRSPTERSMHQFFCSVEDRQRRCKKSLSKGNSNNDIPLQKKHDKFCKDKCSDRINSPDVHKGSDVLPCVHRGVQPALVNTHCSSRNNEGRRISSELSKTSTDPKSSKCKNSTLKPTIKKVISHHLFAAEEPIPDSESDLTIISNSDNSSPNNHDKPNMNELQASDVTEEKPVLEHHKDRTARNSEGKNMSHIEEPDIEAEAEVNMSTMLDVSSSEEEFESDEILRELRNRRNINKSKLRSVEDALKKFIVVK